MLKIMLRCFREPVSEGSVRETVEPPLCGPKWLDDSFQASHRGGATLEASPPWGAQHASDCIIRISPLPNCTACSEAVKQPAALDNRWSACEELTDTSGQFSNLSSGSHNRPPSPLHVEASQQCLEAESDPQRSSASYWCDDLCDEPWQPEDLTSTSRFSCVSSSSFTHSMLMIEV